jgi:basic membrane protein A
MFKRIIALICVFLMALTVFSGCGSAANSDLKVGFVYIGAIGDGGYTYAHNEGRLALEKELGVQTMYVENVSEDLATCKDAIVGLIDQGCSIVYVNSFGHGDAAFECAAEYPDVYFGHATGYLTAANFSNYMGRIYEPRYLSGIAAGLNTVSGKIGYVAAMPIAEVIRGINAFTLGVRSVNPTATVEVIWTNTWYDTTLEKSAAQELINKGCDVIAQHCDSTAPQIAAEEAGVKSIGYNASMLDAAPNAYLTAPLFHWGTFYIDDVKSIIENRYQSRSYWEGLKSGIVSLDTLSANNVEGTADKVAEAQKAIEDGSLYIFTGPLNDNEGTERVASGVAMTDAELQAFNWFVDGVIGTVPTGN